MILLENIRKILSDRIVELRKKRRWTQHDLAAATQLSASGIRGYEQQKRWPKAREFERLSKALDVTPASLLSDPKTNSDLSHLPIDLIQLLAKADKKDLAAIRKVLEALFSKEIDRRS